MNRLTSARDTLLLTVDQYQREQKLNRAIKEFREIVTLLMSVADDPIAVEKTAGYNEAVAFSKFANGNPHTQLGITWRKNGRTSLEKAKNHPNWSEELAVLHKRSRVALAQIVGYEDTEIESDLERRVLPSDV